MKLAGLVTSCAKKEALGQNYRIVINSISTRGSPRSPYSKRWLPSASWGSGPLQAIGALIKFNSIASVSRNATGACTAVMNQIDLIQSDTPFHPQKTNPDGTAQIPPDLQLGT